jgi:hypothetical protein
MSQSTQSVSEFVQALRASRQPEWAEAGFSSFEEFAAHEAALMSAPVRVWIEWKRLHAEVGSDAADSYILSAPMIDEDGEEYYP